MNLNLLPWINIINRPIDSTAYCSHASYDQDGLSLTSTPITCKRIHDRVPFGPKNEHIQLMEKILSFQGVFEFLKSDNYWGRYGQKCLRKHILKMIFFNFLGEVPQTPPPLFPTSPQSCDSGRAGGGGLKIASRPLLSCWRYNIPVNSCAPDFWLWASLQNAFHTIQ